MKGPEFKIGDIVGFKGRGLGFGEIVSISVRDKQNPIYRITALSGYTLVAAYGEHIEKLSLEDLELVTALNSIGNL